MEDKKDILNSLAGQFKQARKLARFKQIEVAGMVGVHPNYYSQVERGVVNPTFDKVYRIAKALNIKNIEIN
jgi:transcriptional regulator with XRE-family HTH domain